MQLTQKGLINVNTEQLKQWQTEFSEKKCIIVPKLIEESLLQKIVRLIDKAEFHPKSHFTHNGKVFAKDLTIDGKSLALYQIHFILNNPQLFKIIEFITGCTTVQGFSGRIYRNMPHSEHHLHWHNDLDDKTRLVALSMNLSKEKYEGGQFQIRQVGSDTLFREVPCGNLGDTHIFKIAPDLEHAVAATQGDFPRTAAAGWFITEVNEDIILNKK